MPFLHGHIIFPSPYLKQEYVTLNGDRIKLREGNIHILDDGEGSKKRNSTSQQHQNKPIKILFDEVFYNEHGSYKAFCTNSPVISSWSSSAGASAKEKSILSNAFGNGGVNSEKNRLVLGKVPRFLQDGNEVFDTRRTMDEWMFVLNRDAKNGEALRFLESFADGIISSYVLVLNKVGIDHFLNKVSSGVNDATKMLITCNPARFESAQSDKNAEAMLRRVLEAYLMTGVYSVVFSSLLSFHRSEILGKEAHQNRYGGLGSKSLNILDTELQEILSNPLLAGLHKQQSPLGKLETLRGFIVKSSNTSGTQCSADYVLSLLVQYVPPPENLDLMSYVRATLQYMTDYIAFRPNNELDFVLTQFQAAVEFVFAQTHNQTRSNATAKIYNQKVRSTILSVPAKPSPESGTSDPEFRTRGKENFTKDQGPVAATGVSSNSYFSPLPRNYKAPAGDKKFKTPNKNNDKQADKKKSSVDDWGGFLQTLKECSADVVTSSYNFN